MNDGGPEMLSLFHRALERTSAAERAAYLDAACGEDARLRGRVEALLRAHEQAGDFLPAQAGTSEQPGTVEDTSVAERPGAVVGPYKLLERIGEGGFGVVFLAEQTEPVRRKVALKVLKAGMDTRQVVARFEAERQALAIMDHPNIARVFDGGTTPAGRPYFVLELVRGAPITEFCDQCQLAPRQRLELFVQVSQAVQHAHQKGIIHRDLKPSNVLVSRHDTTPVAKVIDFGVAKALGQALTDKTLFTGLAQMVGTPLYMSPEQAGLSDLDVDTRSDVYSLGVLLYELLTGTTPFTRDRFQRAGYDEIRRIIREEEPPRPSTRLSESKAALPSIAAQRHTLPAQLARLVRGELDWVVMKALEKDRNRRYESASAFAADVGRYLADEPVLACPPSAAYRLRKFARRNKRGLAVAAMVLSFLVLLGSGAGWALRDRSAREAETARQQEQRQAKVAGEVESILAEVDRLEGAQKWPEALTAARRSVAAVASSEADTETAQRVRQRLRELAFIQRLETVRTERQDESPANKMDSEYARAFREYGVDVLALEVGESVQRLKARPTLAVPLAAALDDWANTYRPQGSKVDDAGRKRLVAVARGIDPEPLRDLLRATWGRPDSEVQGELRRLAESINVRAHHPATLVCLARTLLQVEQQAHALRLLRSAQYAHPSDYWLNFWLGIAHLRGPTKDVEGAIRFFSAAGSIRPTEAAYENLGKILLEQGRLDEAIAAFRKCIELRPTDTLHYEYVGRALRAQGKTEEAIRALRKHVEIHPEDTFAHNVLGFTLRDAKKLDEAKAAFDKAVEIERGYVKRYPKYAGFVYWRLARVLRGQGKLEGAIDAYREALAIDPTFAVAWNNLGYALLAQGKPDEAIDAFRKCIELDLKDHFTYGGLGFALLRQNKVDEALDALRKAIALQPSDPSYHSELGYALLRQKKWPEAADAYRKAIALRPKHAYDYSNLGAALANQGKQDDAIAAWRKALELNPEHAGASNNLSNALSSKAWVVLTDQALARRRALSLANEAVEHAPNSEMAWQYLGWVYYRSGDWRSSIEALERSCRLQKGGKGDAGQWIVLALAHARLAAREGLPLKARELHRKEARRLYEQANRQIDRWWRARPGNETGQGIWDFRAEARGLMGDGEERVGASAASGIDGP